ncbi:MAG TPA: SDR family oxidoreductase [Streptosporangiaceae bacterium]|nr:SDR family oxidoreductase [Streptosporangiaceae bacterium]
MTGRLEGKTALVTGATSNIGRAIAEEFAAEGAHVVVSGRSGQRGSEVVDGIRSRGGRAEFVQADLDGSPEASRALAREATSVLGGRIDILVNNAGIYPGGDTSAIDEKTFDQVYAVNVKAPFFLTAAIAPAMVEAGGGAIINLGSWIARLGVRRAALYSSTKGAMETLTRAWAAEFGPEGVRVNAISPGVVLEKVPGEVHPAEANMNGTPAGRMGRPQEIAHAAVYLASDESAFVHGIVLDVDGGRTTVAVIARWPWKPPRQRQDGLGVSRQDRRPLPYPDSSLIRRLLVLHRGEIRRVSASARGHVQDIPDRPDQVDVAGFLAVVAGGKHQLGRPSVTEPVGVAREHVQDRGLLAVWPFRAVVAVVAVVPRGQQPQMTPAAFTCEVPDPGRV